MYFTIVFITNSDVSNMLLSTINDYDTELDTGSVAFAVIEHNSLFLV